MYSVLIYVGGRTLTVKYCSCELSAKLYASYTRKNLHFEPIIQKVG